MTLSGKAMITIWHDITDEGRDDFYRWHTHEHMPERIAIPGFVRGRRYIAEDGAPEFFVLYETQTIDAPAGPDYLERLNNPTPWTQRAARQFRNMVRSIQNVRFSAGPGMGGYIMTIRFEVEQPDGFVERLKAEVLEKISDVQGIAGVHFGQTDREASDAKTRERDLREGEMLMPGWAILVEAGRRDELDEIREAFLTPESLGGIGAAPEIDTGIYRLEFIRSESDQDG